MGYRYPHFFDWTVPYPHFSERKGEEFALTCCQQMRSAEIINYNKTVLGHGSTTDAAGRAHVPESGEKGVLPSLSLQDPRAPRFSSELVPPLIWPKLHPGSSDQNCFVAPLKSHLQMSVCKHSSVTWMMEWYVVKMCDNFNCFRCIFSCLSDFLSCCLYGSMSYSMRLFCLLHYFFV